MNTARRNARGEASLQRILDATVQLVGRYGYDNTTIARITKATQRPASSIYWFFRDKDELIAAALEHSYTRVARRHRRPWQQFHPALPVTEQLIGELEPELRSSETETPLRLGISLALEGSAASSKVQQPFHRRRAGVLHAIEAWWDGAYAATGAAEDVRAAPAWWMSTLTLALFDGHYISDVDAADPPTVAGRSRITALALVSAYEAMRAADPGAFPLDERAEDSAARTGESAPAGDGEDRAESGPAALLRVVRGLVAEHGYEGATIGRICAAADMQRSSVYWRYKDKDTLIEAAVADPFLALFAPMRELPESGQAWAGDLAAAVGATLRAARHDPDTVKSGLLLKVQQWDPPTAGGVAVLAGMAALEAELTAWLRRNAPSGGEGQVPGEHLAWIVLRLVEGLMFGSVQGRPAPVETVRALFAVLLAGVADRWPTVERQATGAHSSRNR
ncbi:MAG TPA: TetR/AcrR family transcriptional regulator [Nocardia sp.]|uniref:TetR/AcrR family transcriptional regulator n=1 Tax=Nocardia sp. TaxID=1821 RepID=UPI002B4AE355|nr:TetR/AcrR family transcriptional regulator [Nocardia sp.]HLS76954.1 TetR/AcrR family transcriptional regulator [Nocardia sp.]